MTWSSLFFCSSCCRRACSASSLACASLRAFSRSACPAEQCSRQSPSTRCASSSDTARTSSVCVRFISFRCVSLNDMCFSSRSSAYSCNASWVASTSSRSARSKSSSSWICVVTSTPTRISADRRRQCCHLDVHHVQFAPRPFAQRGRRPSLHAETWSETAHPRSCSAVGACRHASVASFQRQAQAPRRKAASTAYNKPQAAPLRRRGTPPTLMSSRSSLR